MMSCLHIRRGPRIETLAPSRSGTAIATRRAEVNGKSSPDPVFAKRKLKKCPKLYLPMQGMNPNLLTQEQLDDLSPLSVRTPKVS